MILDHTLKISSKDFDRVNQPISSDKTAFKFFEQKKEMPVKALSKEVDPWVKELIQKKKLVIL